LSAAPPGARSLPASTGSAARVNWYLVEEGGRLTDRLAYLWRPPFLKFVIHLARYGGSRPTALEGAETFSGDDVLDVPGSPRVIATPGHTLGHCAIHFEAKGVLFVGDALCTRNPITRRVGAQVIPSALNVSTDQCFESLHAIEQTQAQIVLPGHGEPWREGSAAAVDSARRLGRS